MSLKRVTSTLKPWQAILAFIIAAAGVSAIGTRIYHYFEKRTDCQSYVTAAENAFSRDDFDTALGYLNTAHSLCPNDKDIDARSLRVQTFKEAVAYDQVRLVKDPTILTKLNKNLEILRIQLGDTEDLLVLKALYEELMDRPNTAVGTYKEAIKQRPNYAKIYNSWGYTIFKWRLGGSGWSDQALEKFKEAARLRNDYGWPHLNMAAVNVELAETALTDKKDLDGAKKYLADAKTSLEAAEKLLPTNPRVDLLWGHYHIIQARIFSERGGLSLEAKESYSKAKDKLMQSKAKNKEIADTRVLLGSVYLELGMVDEAVYEFNEAVKLDDMNIIACARRVYSLSEKQHSSHPEGAESAEITTETKRGLALINTLRQRFTARKNDTNDSDAKEWLTTAVKTYEPLEKFLKEAEQGNALAQAKSKPRAR
jgi:tetratricopeptide (TPR) repeat protein